MTTTEIVQTERDEIVRIAERQNARDVRVFGWVARGEATENSDLDLRVSAGEEASPWFLSALVEELERLLGRKVEVGTEDGLYWLIRRRILQEARPL